MAASVEFIECARGLPVAVLNSYTYHKSKLKALTNGKKFTCSKRKSVKCKAFVVVSDDGTVVKAEYRSVPAWRRWRWSRQNNSVCIQLCSACASEC